MMISIQTFTIIFFLVLVDQYNTKSVVGGGRAKSIYAVRLSIARARVPVCVRSSRLRGDCADGDDEFVRSASGCPSCMKPCVRAVRCVSSIDTNLCCQMSGYYSMENAFPLGLSCAQPAGM
jgi:hypothetical protein